MARRVEIEPYFEDQAMSSFSVDELGVLPTDDATTWTNALVEQGHYEYQNSFGGIAGGYVGLGETVEEKLQGCISECGDCGMHLGVRLNDDTFNIELVCPRITDVDEAVVDERIAVCNDKQGETRGKLLVFFLEKRIAIDDAKSTLEAAKDEVAKAQKALRDTL